MGDHGHAGGTRSRCRAPPSVVESLRGLAADAGTPGPLREVAELLATDLPTQLDELEGAIDRSDAVAVTLLVHRIKASAGQVGAVGVVHAARTLESERACGDTAGGASAVADLRRELPLAVRALDGLPGAA